MQATITYLLTEQAQRAAMVATGQPVARKQTMTIEVSAEDLDLLPVADDGTIAIDLSGFSAAALQIGVALRAAGWPDWNGSNGIAASQIDPPFLSDLRKGQSLVADQKREKAELQARNGEYNCNLTEEAYRRFLADPAARLQRDYGLRAYVGDLRNVADYWPEQHQEFVAEIERRNQADAAAQKAAKAAAEQAKQDFIALWVASQGDQLLRHQFGEGLACRKTILAMIADEAFTAVGLPDHIVVPETCTSRDCPCCDSTIDCLPRNIYPVWRAVKDGLPAGSAATFSEVRECLRGEDYDGEGESAGPVYYTAEITMPYGPFKFERRVKLA